ncbi:MAG TPA: hypothetical protein VI356_11845 [Myxococcales bacterium]
MKTKGRKVIKPAARLNQIGKDLETAFRQLSAARNDVRRTGAQVRKILDRIDDKDIRYELEALLRRLALSLDGVFLDDQIQWL